MRLARSIVVLTLVCSCEPRAEVARQDTTCLPLTVTNPDGNYIVPGAGGGVVYRRVGGQELRLDFWVPRGTLPRDARVAAAAPARPAHPAVIVIHGGGFTSGSRVAFVGQFLEMLAAAGYPWLSIDYRLGDAARAADAADAVDDVEAAVAFTRCHAGELGIDPERIVLLGEDAGAALAARVAVGRTPGVTGAILIGGLYARLPSRAQNVSPTGGDAAPPRFLVVHGTGDTEAPFTQADEWCASMRAEGSACVLVPVDGASHRPENWWPVQWTYKERVVSWLKAAAPGPPGSLLDRPPADLSKPLAAGLHKRIAYAADVGRPAADRPLPILRTLDAWLPRDRSRPATAVILLHGGGWEAGDRVTYITPIFEPLAKAGFAWFSIDYRLTPAVRHAAQLEDLGAAVAFIRRHAREFGIDPRRVVLVGESASAQMVTLLAARDRTLAAVVSFYGVYDFLPMVTDAGPRSLAARLFGRRVLDEQTRRVLREHSPLERAGRGMAPVLLIHGTDERLWDQGVRMAARLRELGVEHELVRLEGAPHGMENWEGHPAWQFYKARLVSWIRQRVAGPE
jgi:acetyl esterase